MSQRTADGYSEFIYQGPDMLKLQMERDENGKTKVQYTMGNGLEAMRRADGGDISSGDSSFYHYNHLGTTVALTNAAESVSDTYRHDAWGVRLASTGSTVNPHTYVGRERYFRMPDAGLYHLGFRDYAQGVGRFTTVDPLFAGDTGVLVQDGRGHATDPLDGLRAPDVAYAYAGNRPLWAVDPNGAAALPILVVGIGAILIIVGIVTDIVYRDERSYTSEELNTLRRVFADMHARGLDYDFAGCGVVDGLREKRDALGYTRHVFGPWGKCAVLGAELLAKAKDQYIAETILHESLHIKCCDRSSGDAAEDRLEQLAREATAWAYGDERSCPLPVNVCDVINDDALPIR